MGSPILGHLNCRQKLSCLQGEVTDQTHLLANTYTTTRIVKKQCKIQLGQSHCFKPKVLYYTKLYCTVLYRRDMVENAICQVAGVAMDDTLSHRKRGGPH